MLAPEAIKPDGEHEGSLEKANYCGLGRSWEHGSHERIWEEPGKEGLELGSERKGRANKDGSGDREKCCSNPSPDKGSSHSGRADWLGEEEA